MPALKYVLWFDEIDKDDIAKVGGKGANLGEMTQAGFPVPDGFVVTSSAYRHLLEENNLEDKIRSLLKDLDTENPRELARISQNIKRLIERADIPEEVETEIRSSYERLGKGKPIYVAVRSSATAEDLPGASFAGQQETFLNIKGDTSVVQHVRMAWASLFEPRAIYYRVQKGFDHFKVSIAVPVQKMVDADVSGIMFTVNPMTRNKRVVVIEAIWGLGEKIVQGQVTPDHYEVDKTELKIASRVVVPQRVEMRRKGDKNVDAKVPKSRVKAKKLSDQEVIELATLAKKLQQHYFYPQDVEWAIENGTVYIVQTRPITTLDRAPAEPVEATQLPANSRLILQGDPASPGMATGVTRILRSAKEITKVKTGDVLITKMTTPDFVPAMKKAVAIVTDEGGQTSHAAIVSRELGVPCVVGTKNGSKVLKKHKFVTVDGSSGKVYTASSATSSVVNPPTPSPEPYHLIHPGIARKTATKLYVNLGEPSLAEEIASRDVDGVGLLRAEFMIAEIGTHPKKLINEGKSKVFVDKLASGLETFCKAFSPRPVIYRATDFKTNEYRNLKGGEAYEPVEPNPLIGYRGAYRYLHDPEVFQLELEAIKKVRNKLGYKNLSLMLPFVRSVEELQKVKKLVVGGGLSRSPSFKLWMMVELPVNVILLEDFIDVGLDGVSVGTNDLTMLLLGTDRDNEGVASAYDERNPSVLWALEHICKVANKKGITVSICGQAPSTYPEITELLVKNGATSVSVSPDMIEKTREIIYETEKRLILHA